MTGSVFRAWLQVSPERIARLTDNELDVLIRDLLREQARICGVRESEAYVNTEAKAKDDGCDAWSGRPATADPWLGDSETCWQLKAGVAGEPSRLKGEVAKRIPAETLKAGGRLVVIASGSTNGRKGQADRQKVLIDEAGSLAIPSSQIEVFGSERLTEWCNRYPAVALKWSGGSDSLITFEEWAAFEEHQVEWHAANSVNEALVELRDSLSFEHGAVHHLHIHGLPGVGKSRLALELSRDAAWNGAVIYIRQAADVNLAELIGGVVRAVDTRMVLIVDEVQSDQLLPLREHVGRAAGRVRLITIGHTASPDPERIPALLVKPLEVTEMEAIVSSWYPQLPREHVQFVVRFADGYVRLAKLAAQDVVRRPTLNVKELMELSHIRGFLDGMLGKGDRRSLYVVAALSSVGWTGDRAVEGEAIAKHFGFDWATVRADVERFHRQLGIAPRGGRLRYLSPMPLAIHLAIEAWDAFPDVMRSLPEVLPSEQAKEAYYDRLQRMASSSHAREFAREELRGFFHLDRLSSVEGARRWAILAAADPSRAAKQLLALLEGAGLSERLRIESEARRYVVGALTRIGWKSETFGDAALCLAYLSEAENEKWANNATSEFVGFFRILLGGTAAPYLDRLNVIDEILKVGRSSLTSLAVEALSQVGNLHPSRISHDPIDDAVPEPEWRPKSGEEHVRCAEAALDRLGFVAKQSGEDQAVDLAKATRSLGSLLRFDASRKVVLRFFENVVTSVPSLGEVVRRVVDGYLRKDAKYWHELTETGRAELSALRDALSGSETRSRLLDLVGGDPWDREPVDFGPIAKEFVENSELLAEELPWLISGEASDAWRFGGALANADTTLSLEELLSRSLLGATDNRVVLGYVNGARERLGDEWFDSWVDRRAGEDQFEVLAESLWRIGSTESLINHLIERIKSGQVPDRIDQLAFGKWYASVASESLLELVKAIHAAGRLSVVVALVDSYVEEVGGFASKEWQEFALLLATDSALIRSGHMDSYHWKRIALRLVAGNGVLIAGAILAEQADRRKETWFAEYSEALEVLRRVSTEHPSEFWAALAPHLEANPTGFVIGFPSGLLDGIPYGELHAWVDVDPERRASTLLQIVDLDLLDRKSIASQLMRDFGGDERVRSSFFGRLISGSFSGSSSEHWRSLGERVEGIARASDEKNMKRWAAETSASLLEMSERDREREEEDRLRWR